MLGGNYFKKIVFPTNMVEMMGKNQENLILFKVEKERKNKK